MTIWDISQIKKFATSQELVPSAGTPYKLCNQETTGIFSKHLKCLNSFNRHYLLTKQEQLLQPNTITCNHSNSACLLQCVKLVRVDAVSTMRYVVAGLSCGKGILSHSESVNQLYLVREYSAWPYRVMSDWDLTQRVNTCHF